MRLHLGEDVRGFLPPVVVAGRIGIKAPDVGPLDHRGIVGIGDHSALRAGLVAFANHAEQGVQLILAIDGPARIEYLVAAMFRIRLRKHHQLDIGRVALEAGEVVDQVINLVVRERQAKFHIRLYQCCASAAENVDTHQWLWRDMMKQRVSLLDRFEHRLGHAIVQSGGNGIAIK